MKKKWIMRSAIIACILCVVIAAVILLPGFAAQKPGELFLSELQDETGRFVYPNIPWQITITELEDALGIQFDKPDYHSFFDTLPKGDDFRDYLDDFPNANFTLNDYVSLYDTKCKVRFQLWYNRLVSVEVSFPINYNEDRVDLDPAADKLLKDLILLYGAEYITDEVGTNNKEKTYKWLHSEPDGALNVLSVQLHYYENKVHGISFYTAFFYPESLVS